VITLDVSTQLREGNVLIFIEYSLFCIWGRDIIDFALINGNDASIIYHNHAALWISAFFILLGCQLWSYFFLFYLWNDSFWLCNFAHCVGGDLGYLLIHASFRVIID
jgi:hypothetical protein